LRLLVATTNQDKLREIRSLLGDVAVDLVTLRDLPAVAEPEETGTTFAENALLKARYYGEASGLMTVAEDSGLVVDALDGEPGVRSARFLRPDASYNERFGVILRRLSEHPERGRSARFLCGTGSATTRSSITRHTAPHSPRSAKRESLRSRIEARRSGISHFGSASARRNRSGCT
jgi:non-canonical purine NTP pyrophosphatase (RdgB/HAM1 family)